MNKEELSELNKQIDRWQEKRDKLADWLQSHHIDHPDFEAKFREQNNVIIKIRALKERKNPVKCDVPETYRIPPRTPNARF